MPRLDIYLGTTLHTRALVPASATEADAAALQARLDALRRAGALTEATLDAAVREAHGRLWASKGER